MAVVKGPQLKASKHYPDWPPATFITVRCARCHGNSHYSKNDLLTRKPCVHCDWAAVTRWMRERLAPKQESS